MAVSRCITRWSSGASPDLVVRKGAPDLLEPFIEAGRELIGMGVAGITTNCGFLSLFQHALKSALDVPVAASSLMQAPMIEMLLPPGQRVGILTISAATLSPCASECRRCAGRDSPLLAPMKTANSPRRFSTIGMTWTWMPPAVI